MSLTTHNYVCSYVYIHKQRILCKQLNSFLRYTYVYWIVFRIYKCAILTGLHKSGYNWNNFLYICAYYIKYGGT